MTAHLQADTSVANALLARFPFTSYNSIVQARVELAQCIRLSMQFPQAYTIPLNQQLPAEQGRENIAQYVHPWNVACALINVCLNGARFGGENLAPQEDLMLHVDGWHRLSEYTFPTAIVPLQQTPAPAAITQAPASPSLPPAPPQPLDAVVGAHEEDLVAARLRAEADAEATAPPVLPSAVAQQPLPGLPDAESPAAKYFSGDAEVAAESDLPDPSITLERTGQSGRPQKSPFEKKIEARNKVAPAPFWWDSLIRSAPKIFHKSPAGALDDSSTGAGPVQSYMVLVALLRYALHGVEPRTSVAALRTYLADIDGQVSRLESAAAANQLRDILVPKK